MWTPILPNVPSLPKSQVKWQDRRFFSPPEVYRAVSLLRRPSRPAPSPAHTRNPGDVTVGFDYLIPRWTVIDPAVKEDFEALGRLGRGAFTIDSRDDADRLWVVRYASPSLPPTYVLYDHTTRTTCLIFETLPALDGYALAATPAGIAFTPDLYACAVDIVGPENNLDFVGRVEEFLARYLGGRAEPWREVPGSSAEVR